MRELLEQNSYDKDKGVQAPDPLNMPQMNMEDLQQALQGLQGLEGDVTVSQNQIQLNEQQEQILFDQLKTINDMLRGIDHNLQVNDSWGGWINGVVNAPSASLPGSMPTSVLFSKVAMHQAIYKGNIVSQIQAIDKEFSKLKREHFLSSNRNKGRWLELNKMYLEMVTGVGSNYNAIPKLIKDVKARLTYANTILPQLSLVDVRWSQHEKQQAKRKEDKERVQTPTDAAPSPETNVIMTTDETLDDLQEKLRRADVSYSDQALESTIPYFKNLYQQVYQKIQADQTLTSEQRKQRILRLACIITGRGLVYQNWEKNAPRITENGAKETITRSQDNYDWFREEGNSSNGIHDKFMDPEFAEKILHTELLGADDLSNQETVFSKIINNAGIPVEHKFVTPPEKLYEMYGTNPQRNLPDPITLQQTQTGRKTSGFDGLSYRDRLQYVVLDKFLQNQTDFLQQEMAIVNAARTEPFSNVEEFANYLEVSGEVQQYESNFAELRNQAVISTGNVVKEKLPEYLKHNDRFGGVRSKDFPWLTDRYDRGILDVYQSIMGTGRTISDGNAMAIKEGSKIVGQIGLSLAAGFVIPGGRLAGLSTVARLAVTASVMATTNVVANQVMNRPDYVDPFEAITDMSTQFVFDAGSIFVGGVAMQKFGYGFKTFAQTLSKRGSVNWALSLGDLTLGTVAENFRQSFFMDNPPMGFREQFKSPIGWIGFIFMMFGVKNLNKAERNSLKRNYAKLSQYVKENPQIRSMHLDFTDIDGKKQFITVGELLDAIDLKKGVKLTKVPALSADIDKIKPLQKIDAHTQRVHDNAALRDDERPGTLERQLQEEGLLGAAETPKMLTAAQKTGINAVHDLSTKSLEEIGVVYQDKTSYEGEGTARKLTAAAKKRVQKIIKNNNPDDPRPAVLQHTIDQMQTKKKLLQDIYDFDKKQAHYLVKSGGVGYLEGKSFVGRVDNGLTDLEKMLDNADNQFVIALGKSFDVQKVEVIIAAIKKKLIQIDRDVDELTREIQQMRRDLPTKSKGKEHSDFLAQITELENQKLELQRRRTDVVEKYKIKIGKYRDHLATRCVEKADELLKKKTTVALLDRYVDLDEKTSSQLGTAIKEIEILELEIKKLDELYLGNKLEAGLTDVDPHAANIIREKKRQIEQKKQDLANRKRELIEARNKKVKKEKAITEAKKDADTVDTKIKSLEKKKDKLTDADITDLETDINKLERKHSAVSREEVGGRSKKTTLEERIEAQKKKLAELRKLREAAKFKKKYDEELYDEFYNIDKNAGDRTKASNDRIDKLEKKIDAFERDNTGKLGDDYVAGKKTYKQHIAEMRERLAEIKLNRKNIALKEMEDDMNLALRNIDDFVEAQKGTSGVTSDLDLSDAKNQLAAAKAELDAINKKITAESKEGDRSPESGKKRKQYLIDLKGKVSNMELKLTKYELDQDLEGIETRLVLLQRDFADPAKVKGSAFDELKTKIDKLEEEFSRKTLLREKLDPDDVDPNAPTYQTYFSDLRNDLAAAHLNYKKHRANTFIIDPIDGVDLIYNRYNTDPLTADKDKLDALDKQIDSLQAEVRTYDLGDQEYKPGMTYNQYIKSKRNDLLLLRQKVRVHKAALEITNRTGNGIDDLSREYSRYPADGSVDKVEALERRLESLESQVKDDLDQVIPGGRETYRDYIHRKKQELPELKKTVKDFHGIAAANQVRRIVSEYQDLLRSTGTFATQNELDTLRAKKAELDEISKKLDDPKVDGRSKLTPDDRVALEAVNKNHDTNISSRIHIEELRKKIDPLLTDHLKLLLSNGDPRVPIKTALVAGGNSRRVILEMLADAHLMSMIVESGILGLDDALLRRVRERNGELINILQGYRKNVTVNLSGPDGRSVWKEAYWYTFQETVDSLIWYSAIAKKYKASGNPLVQKFGGIMEKESHRASLIIGGGYDFDDAKEGLAKDITELKAAAASGMFAKKDHTAQVDATVAGILQGATTVLSGKAFTLFQAIIKGIKQLWTKEGALTGLYSGIGLATGGIDTMLINWFLTNPLISSNAFGSKAAPFLLRLTIILLKETGVYYYNQAVEKDRKDAQIENVLEAKDLFSEYQYYLSPERIKGDTDAKTTKQRIDTRLGDKNPRNDEDAVLDLVEYLNYAKFMEFVNSNDIDPGLKQHILGWTDYERQNFARENAKKGVSEPEKIQGIVAERERSNYTGKPKSQIPAWLLKTPGVLMKLTAAAEELIESRNRYSQDSYEETIQRDPWIKDFVDKEKYQQIISAAYQGSTFSPQSLTKELLSTIAPESIPDIQCPQPIQNVLEGLVDEASDPSEEFEYEGRVMSGNNRTPRKVS